MNSGPGLNALRLERTEVGRLEPLASGGQAFVLRAPELTVDDVDGPLVVKLYKSHCPPIPWVGLARLAKQRLDASPRHRAQLDRYFTWPVRVVVEGDRTVGCVMPELHPRFFHDFQSRTGKVRAGAVEIQHLMAAPRKLLRVGLPEAASHHRHLVCFEIARALHLLHATKLIYGDINARNVLVSLRPTPTIAFVEGDALRRSGASAVVPQVETDDWQPPERPKVQSEWTDRYKLGLMVLRILTPGDFSSRNRDPSVLDDVLDHEGCLLARRAVGPDALQRPAPLEWVEYFRFLLTGSRGRPSGPGASSQPGAGNNAPTGQVPRVDTPSVRGSAWVRRNGAWVPGDTPDGDAP